MSSIKLKHSGGNSVSLNPPTSAPTSSEVAFKLPNADGSAGQYMKTDGSGNLAFATISTPVAGITVWDTWHFGSTISNYEGDLTDSAYGSDIGLVRPSALSNGIAWGSIGTGMTESGGIFTFPQTGMWEIVADYVISSSTAQQYSIGRIEVSADSGTSWQDFAEGGNAAPSNGTYSFRFGGLMDVTNVSTTRIKLSLHVTANWTSGHSLDGSSTYKRSGVEFRRIGDT